MSGYGDALALATIAHSGQFYGDRPYIEHPVAVAKLILDVYGVYEHLLIPALLHDTVEDTPVALTDLIREFGSDNAATVACVTRQRDETYAQFVERAARHVDGRIVKLADNTHNLGGLPPDDGRRTRYVRARRVLVAAEGRDPFAEQLLKMLGAEEYTRLDYL